MTYTQPATVEDSSKLKESESLLLSELDAFRNKLSLKASNATIISILDQFPCLLKCVHDIRMSGYHGGIDPLYRQKHDFVKKRLIDAIVRTFSNKLAVSSEEKINNGTIDICISSDKIIRINTSKRVGIEVKSGRSIDLFQIRRYLCELDILIVVRLPTREVSKIFQKDITQELIDDNFLTIQKIQQIEEQGLIKVKGEWCKGCTAPCQYKKPDYASKPTASLDYPQFMKDVNVIVEKVIHELELEFETN